MSLDKFRKWELLSAVLGVSISNAAQEVEAKYTLDDRLDARATDNGANFAAAVEELMENGICEEHVCCAPTAVNQKSY